MQAQNDFRSKSVKVFKRNTKYVEDKPIKGVFQPTIASTRDGTIHLFAQGRLYNSHDNTEKVLLYKSSEDHGDSWSDTKYLTPPGSFWGIASYVVVDSVTDSEHINVIFVYSKVKLFELYSKQELTTLFNISKEDYSEVQTSILYRLSSSDNGETWQHKVLKRGFFSYSDIERIKGTDYYIVAFARVHHGELGLSTKRFHKSWLFGNKL